MNIIFLRVAEFDWRYEGYEPRIWGFHLEYVYHGIAEWFDDKVRVERANTGVPIGKMEVAHSGSFVPHMFFPSLCGPIVSPAVQERLTNIFPCTFVDVIWRNIVDLPFPSPDDDPPESQPGGSEGDLLRLPYRPDLARNLEGFREWFAPELRILIDYASIPRKEMNAMKNDYHLFRTIISRRYLDSELLVKHPVIKSYGGFIIREDMFQAIKDLIDSKILGAVSYCVD